MIKIVYLALISMILSCQKTLIIDTEPKNSRILYNGSVFRTPVELEIVEDSELTIRKEHYKEITFNSNEVKKLKKNKNPIQLIPIKYLLKINNRIDAMQVYINGEKAPIRIELPFGDHNIKIKREGYFDFNAVVSITETKEIQPKLEKKYFLKYIPNEVSNIKIDNKDILLNTAFPINFDTFTFNAEYSSPIISFNYKNKKIHTKLHKKYIDNSELKLQKIIDEYTLSTNMPQIKVESDWIKEYESKTHIKRLFSSPTGFESMPDNLIEGDNKIISKPLNLFPHLSIANPTSDLIGSYFIAKSGKSEKKYEITAEFYNSNLDEMYAGEEYNPDGIYTKQKFLKIDNLNLDAPYNNAEIECYLYIDNKITDSTKLIVNEDVYNKFGDTSYGVYSKLRNSIFLNNKTSSRIHYLYADKSRSGEFLIIYMSKNREYIPIQTYKIGEVSSTPTKIILDESDTNNYFILITKDLSKIENWYVRQLKYFTNK